MGQRSMLSCWRRGRWQPAAAAAAGPAPAASTAREAACKRLQGAQISPGWPARRPRAPERGAVQWWAGTPAPAPYLSMHAFTSVPGVHCYSAATLQALPRAAWAATFMTGASRPPPSVCRSFAALHRLNAVLKQSTTLLPLPAKRYAHSHAAGSAGPGRLPGGPAHRGSGRGGAPAAAGGWGRLANLDGGRSRGWVPARLRVVGGKGRIWSVELPSFPDQPHSPSTPRCCRRSL